MPPCLHVQALVREANTALEKAREKAAHFKQEAERAAAENSSASKQVRARRQAGMWLSLRVDTDVGKYVSPGVPTFACGHACVSLREGVLACRRARHMLPSTLA